MCLGKLLHVGGVIPRMRPGVIGVDRNDCNGVFW